MNRKSPRHPGVYQRCRGTCPPDRCRVHKWAYSVELPAGPNGERQQVWKGGYETAKAAAEARAELLRKHRAGEMPVDGKMTVAQWLTRWLATQADVRGLRPGTLVLYQQHAEAYLIPRLGHLRLVDLRAQHVTDMLADVRREREALRAEAIAANERYAAAAAEADEIRKAKGLKRPVKPKRVAVPRAISPSTAQRIHATLRAALNAAIKAADVGLTRNVAVSAVIPRGVRPKVRPWEPEQLGAFLDLIADERLYPLYHLGAFAGLRRGELCGLSWDDVDLGAGRVVVRWQHPTVRYKVIRSKPKSRDGEDRIVDLDAATVAVLKALRKRQAAERLEWGPAYVEPVDDGGKPLNLVFTKENGEPYHPDYVYKTFVRLVRKARLRLIPLHHLRHGAASLQLASGTDIAVVSKRMGHSTISLTSDTYGHLIGKAGKQAAEAAAALVPRKKAV